MSEAVRRGEAAADRAATSETVEWLGRAGILARAVVYLVVAGIALDIVHGGGGDRSADSKGALEALASTGPGLVLLVLLAVAFAGHALWRVVEAATGLRQDHGRRRTAKRLGFVAVAVLYAALCGTTVRVLAGRSQGSENGASHRAASDVLGLPGGRPLTLVIGVAVIAGAIGVVGWAGRGGFLRSLRLDHLGQAQRRAVRALGVIGQASRALVIAAVGALFVDAALRNDSSRAQGLDGTLRAIADQPFGSLLLLVAACGLLVFGVYSVAEAFLRRTTEDDPRSDAGRQRQP